MEQDPFVIGAKVEHPQFGEGIITDSNLTSLIVFFKNRGDKVISRSFQGLKLIEKSKVREGSSQAPTISLADLERVFTGVLKRYADFPETVELGDRWKRGTMILKPESSELMAREIPIESFFHKIVLVRDRLRVLEQRINSNEKLDDEEKVNLQQYITRIYGSLTTFNLLFKYKEQYFIGEKGSKD